MTVVCVVADEDPTNAEFWGALGGSASDVQSASAGGSDDVRFTSTYPPDPWDLTPDPWPLVLALHSPSLRWLYSSQLELMGI